MLPIKLSICIVNLNSGVLLDACLRSISDHEPSCNYEVIVVDNASVDDSQLCANEYKHVHLIQNDKYSGFALANNQTFDSSHGEYLLMLNADTEVQENSLDELIVFAETHPRAGLISAQLVNPDGSTQIGFNVRKLPSLGMAFMQLSLLDEIFPNNPITRSADCGDLDYNQPQLVEQPAGSALIFRRTAWEEIGGLDPTFRIWYNDCDLCKRVRDAGWEIWYCPTSRITHYGGRGSSSWAVKDVLIELYRSMRLYYLKHFGLSCYFMVSFLTMTGMLLRVLILFVNPKLEKNVSVHSSKKDRSTQRNGFWAVFRDTAGSLISLQNGYRHS
jgi:GT2 family glycosyltransferase